MTTPLDLSTPLDVPELASIGLELDLAALTRHVLVLGSSGSGKSASIVIPTLRALLRQRRALPDAHKPSVIVIDPKRELEPVVHRECDQVRVVGTEASPPIDLFAATDRGALDAGAVADRYIALAGVSWDSARDPFWRIMGRSALLDCVAIDLKCGELGGAPPDAQVRRAMLWRDLASTMLKDGRVPKAEVRVLTSMRAPITRYLSLLRLLARAPGGGESKGAVLLEKIATHVPDLALPALWRLPELASDTATSIVATAAGLVGPLASARVQRAVRLDVLAPLRTSPRLDLFDCIRRGEVVLYQPDDGSEESATMSRALKAATYDAVLAGAACTPEGKPQRVAALVIDEFQRVITSAGISDAQYLDRCRSFGGACVLATQSVSALRERLPEHATDSVRALLTNTATRITMATTDADTIDELRALIPPPAIPAPHVLDVRTLAMAASGEACWVGPGAWGIGRVKLSEEAELDDRN